MSPQAVTTYTSPVLCFRYSTQICGVAENTLYFTDADEVKLTTVSFAGWQLEHQQQSSTY